VNCIGLAQESISDIRTFGMINDEDEYELKDGLVSVSRVILVVWI